MPASPSQPRKAGPTSLAESCLPVDLEVLHLPKSERMFAVRVRGMSMQGAGIWDGDNVLMEFRDPAPGEIVVALVNGQTLLRRYVVENRRAFLKAEHPAHPGFISAQELVIQGVMVALLRLPPGKNPKV